MAHEKALRDVARAEELHTAGVAALALVQDARTSEEVARASLRMARFDAQHAEIRAPANGVILARLVEENEMVSPGVPVLAFKTRGAGLDRAGRRGGSRRRAAAARRRRACRNERLPRRGTRRQRHADRSSGLPRDGHV